jgi:hypothetical protein
MIDNQLIPDVVIQLDAESKDVLKRILPKRMEQWAVKMKARRDKRMRNKAKKDRDKVRKKSSFEDVENSFFVEKSDG